MRLPGESQGDTVKHYITVASSEGRIYLRFPCLCIYTGEGQWKPSSDHCREPFSLLLLLPGAPTWAHLQAIPPRGRDARGWSSDLHPQGGAHTGGEDPWQGGCEQASQGSVCFFVGGGRLTSLAHELRSTPCSIAAFTIYHFLARSLVTLNCRISCFGDLGWERDQRVRLHCVFFTAGEC